MKDITRKLVPLILALAITLTLTIAASASASPALSTEAPKVVQEINISIPDKNLEIRLTKVGDRAIIFTSGGLVQLFLSDDSTLTFSRDVSVRVSNNNESAEVTWDADKTYTYEEYNKKLQDGWASVQGGSYSPDSFMVLALADYSTTVENHKKNNFGISIVDITTLAAGLYGAEFERVTVAIPYIPGLEITLTNVPRLFEEMDYISGTMGLVRFYYGAETTIRFNKDIKINTVDFKSGQAITASDFESGTLFTIFTVSGNGTWTNSSEMNSNIREGQKVYMVAFVDAANYPKNVADNKGFTDIGKWETRPSDEDRVTTTGASDWAKAELQEAIDINFLPTSVTYGAWTDATSRITVTRVLVAVIEKAEGKTMARIAEERGWDLDKNGFSDTNSRSATFFKYAGVTNGVGNNRFDPNSSITRAQIVTMIGRIAEAFFDQPAQGENPFTDVPNWAAPFVGYAADNGITTGVGGGRFDSDGILQNQHTAIFCYRVLNAWTQKD